MSECQAILGKIDTSAAERIFKARATLAYPLKKETSSTNLRLSHENIFSRKLSQELQHQSMRPEP